MVQSGQLISSFTELKSRLPPVNRRRIFLKLFKGLLHKTTLIKSMVKVDMIIIGKTDQMSNCNRPIASSIEILLLNQSIEFECAWQKIILKI